MTAPSLSPCPSCGAPASGHFCSSCGAPLSGAICGACRSLLSAGAKFCHRCGTAVGAAPIGAAPMGAAPAGVAARGDGRGTALPWAIALVSLLVLVAFFAGRNFSVKRGSALDAPSNALPQEGLDDRGAARAGSAPAGGRAPDISALSPRERADRLYDRVMRLDSEGKADSVQFFAPMALAVYQTLGPLDADTRYDFGRIGQVTGNSDIARAQADTILRDAPTHLLGLVLAADAAKARGDSDAARDFRRRLIAAEPAERRKNLDEYQRHGAEIDRAMAAARGSER